MSIERELLKRVISGDDDGDFFISHRLYKDIETFLAQPEQDPVAWCQMVEGKVQDLLTSFEMKDWLYDKSWMPLYLAPPKREPLTPRQGLEEYKRGYAQAELDLKRQPLTNENSDTVSAFNPVSNNYWSR